MALSASGYIGEIAGEGNRTPVCSLGSCRSTIELHPLKNSRFSIATCDLQAGNNHCHEITSPEPEKLPAVPDSAVKPAAGAPPPNTPFLPNDHAITPM